MMYCLLKIDVLSSAKMLLVDKNTKRLCDASALFCAKWHVVTKKYIYLHHKLPIYKTLNL